MTAIGNLLGVRMNLLIGPDPVAAPAPLDALSSLMECEVKLSDTEPSGIRLVFAVGRSGPLDFLDVPMVTDPRFSVGARVIVSVVFGVMPDVLFDGIIHERNLRPGSARDEGTLTLLGRDLTVQLDRHCKRQEYPGMDETAIAFFIAGQYPQYGMLPGAIPPPVVDLPSPTERIPMQTTTDLEYLQSMAEDYGYETYVEAGPAPFVNTLYWGPAIRPGLPQRTLSVNQGPASDAYDVDIDHSIEDISKVETTVIDRQTGLEIPVVVPVSTRPPLGLLPESVTRAGQARTKCMVTSGLNAAQALGRAAGTVDRDAGKAIKVTGKINTIRYNAALKARQTVDLRGVGMTFNGTYKVSEVRHTITPGTYDQSFTLSRSELMPAAPVVRTV